MTLCRSRFGTLLLLALGGPTGMWAQAQGSSGAEERSAKILPARAAEEATSEVFRNVIVPADKSVSFDSKIDFSAASQVFVTLRCTTCNAASNSMASIVVQAFWSVPDAEHYAVVETRTGSTFPYWDSGGAAFQVFGPLFRLTLQNRSNQNVIIQQVTVFRRTP